MTLYLGIACIILSYIAIDMAEKQANEIEC